MNRVVEPELLDGLLPDDPRARASRADLRRLNAFMGNPRLAARALASALGDGGPKRIVELGAGDGNFLFSVGRLLAARWPQTEVVLVDRHRVAGHEELSAFGRLGWRVECVTADVFDWLSRAVPEPDQVFVANLFLHHFSDKQVAELFRQSAALAQLFVAVEPRRYGWALVCCRFVGLLGCSAVTRHDARLSVRAGFAGNELTRLWPASAEWLVEGRDGVFSHLFVAKFCK